MTVFWRDTWPYFLKSKSRKVKVGFNQRCFRLEIASGWLRLFYVVRQRGHSTSTVWALAPPEPVQLLAGSILQSGAVTRASAAHVSRFARAMLAGCCHFGTRVFWAHSNGNGISRVTDGRKCGVRVRWVVTTDASGANRNLGTAHLVAGLVAELLAVVQVPEPVNQPQAKRRASGTESGLDAPKKISKNQAFDKHDRTTRKKDVTRDGGQKAEEKTVPNES